MPTGHLTGMAASTRRRPTAPTNGKMNHGTGMKRATEKTQVTWDPFQNMIGIKKLLV